MAQKNIFQKIPKINSGNLNIFLSHRKQMTVINVFNPKYQTKGPKSQPLVIDVKKFYVEYEKWLVIYNNTVDDIKPRFNMKSKK